MIIMAIAVVIGMPNNSFNHKIIIRYQAVILKMIR